MMPKPFLVGQRIDKDDYHFRVARFWANENPFAMWVSPNLIEALSTRQGF
jgi:hypothetical protein